MRKVRTKPWDPAEHLQSTEDVFAYLQAALEYGDPTLMAAVVEDIARSPWAAGLDRS